MNVWKSYAIHVHVSCYPLYNYMCRTVTCMQSVTSICVFKCHEVSFVWHLPGQKFLEKHSWCFPFPIRRRKCDGWLLVDCWCTQSRALILFLCSYMCASSGLWSPRESIHVCLLGVVGPKRGHTCVPPRGCGAQERAYMCASSGLWGPRDTCVPPRGCGAQERVMR